MCIRDRIGIEAPAYNPASLLEGNITAYENRFTNPLINTVIDDFDRVRDMRIQKLQDDAINSGAFGGNRSAIFEQEGTRALDEEMLQTIASLRESAFDKAMKGLEADTDRIDTARRVNANMFGSNMDRQIGVLDSLLADQYNLFDLTDSYGGTRRGIDQLLLDAEIDKFDEYKNIPLERLGILQAATGQISPEVIGRTKRGRTSGFDLGDLGDFLSAIGDLGN